VAIPITLSFTPDKGHLMLPIGDRMALIDTGSPSSISSRPFDFCGERQTAPDQMMGVTTKELSIEGVADHFAQMIFCMLQLPCFHFLLPINYSMIVLAIADRL
jgi:hypothetical protein